MQVTIEQLDAFVMAVQAMIDADGRRKVVIGYDKSRIGKYVRIVEELGAQKAVYCFVRSEDGAILKAAGWVGPAKHARGNIANGAAELDPYGPAYLK